MLWSWPGPGRGRSPISPTIFGSQSRVCAAGLRQVDVDSGRVEDLTSNERAELVRLRRETRVQAMEIEILKRASAFFARENVLPR